MREMLQVIVIYAADLIAYAFKLESPFQAQNMVRKLLNESHKMIY